MTVQADIIFERELWETAVTLRGTVAPADYKHYVLPLLFLRYLSLRYEQRKAELAKLVTDPNSDYYTGDPDIDAEVLADKSEYEKQNVYVVPDEASWDTIRSHARAGDIKLRIDKAMQALEEAYPTKLGGVLPRIYAGSNLTTDQVAGLISLFSKDVFAQKNGADYLGRTYEYFITNFASTEGNRGGEFFTTSCIVKLLVEMLEPKSGTVFDPASGSCGMFVQSAHFTDNTRALSFYGQENVETTLRLGRMNLILHGLLGDVRLGNSLLNDQHPALKANTVISNPPFNLRDWGADKIDPNDPRLTIGYRKVQPTNSNANYMWMMHMLYHLADGGTAGYVMANGAMTTNTREEKEARQALVDEGLVDCIVQMPDRLFFGTGIPCCLWFLSKNRTGTHGYRDRRNEILFIDARSMGEMVNRRQRVITDSDIGRMAELYRRYKRHDAPPDVLGMCKVATLDEVRNHDYKLTPGIYVGTQAADEDAELYVEKMPRFIEELQELFRESERLQKQISIDLNSIGN